MKKNYVKPCSSCVAMAAEQAMLVGSKGLRVTNENLERADPIVLVPSTAGGAKKNPFDYDEE